MATMSEKTGQYKLPSLTSMLEPGLDLDKGSAGKVLPEILKALRAHLQMDVAFIAEFTRGQRVLRYVDAADDAPLFAVGAADPLEESYCVRIVDGRLPALMRDAAEIPEASALPITRSLPVGAHLSVPIKLEDGSVYGTFCCFSTRPDPSLNERDLELLRVFAEVAAGLLQNDVRASRKFNETWDRVQAVLDGHGLSMVYQPIFDIEFHRVVGFEALARFSAKPARSPDVWFRDADAVGLGQELEARAIETALALDLQRTDAYLACNVSPQLVLNDRIPKALLRRPLDRIVLEITEHQTIKDYSGIARVLDPLRRRGLRVAVDDAGAGYASFRHILSLKPDFIKLDMSLTRDIDSDIGRRSLAAALIGFARETQSELIAEGVETAAELATLECLGVSKAQGYFLGRPMPAESARQLVTASAAQLPSSPTR
jgi:EAL domain-containing protein (putative c-di-GMP-specific phosphodiesterase class I)